MSGVTLEVFDAPDDAVILVHDPEGQFSSDRAWDDFCSVMSARFPRSFLVAMHGDTSFETISIDELEVMLSDAIAHRVALGDTPVTMFGALAELGRQWRELLASVVRR